MKITHDLPDGTEEDVIDMIAKAMLLRTGAQSTLVTWEDLERASKLACEIVKCAEGVVIRSKMPAVN